MYQIDGKDQIGKVSKFQIDRMRGKQMTDRTRKKQQPKCLPSYFLLFFQFPNDFA